MATYPMKKSEIEYFEQKLADFIGLSVGRINANLTSFQDEVDWLSIMHPDYNKTELDYMKSKGFYSLKNYTCMPGVCP